MPAVGPTSLSQPTLARSTLHKHDPRPQSKQTTLYSHFSDSTTQSSNPLDVCKTPNPTSSAHQTALVCPSRTSKLSTRSRKQMKTPARSSSPSRITFTFVFNVRPLYVRLSQLHARHCFSLVSSYIDHFPTFPSLLSLSLWLYGSYILAHRN